jgi:hypothetical protein
MNAARRARRTRKVPSFLTRKAHRPKLRHALPAAGLAAGLAAAPLLGHLQAPSVFAECEPDRDDDDVHYMAGTHRPDVNATAVRAAFRVGDTWVLPDGDDKEAAYGHVELAYLGGAGYRYVSAGWLEFPGGNPATTGHLAVRWNHWNGDTQWKDLDPPAVENSEPLFSAYLHYQTGDYFVFYVDGVEEWRLTQGQGAPAFEMFIPNHANIHGRTSSLGSQMPGTLSAFEEISNAELRIGDGGFADFMGDEYSSNPTYFGSDKINGRHWHVWDKGPCI